MFNSVHSAAQRGSDGQSTPHTSLKPDNGETILDGILLPLAFALVGLVIGIPSYITKKRRWPGMIAGFEPAKCTDVDGLTRWVGGAGMLLGCALLVGAVAVYVAPQYLGAVAVMLALVGVIGSIATQTGCARFTRR